MTSQQFLDLLTQAMKIISWLGLTGTLAVIVFAKKTAKFLIKIIIAIVIFIFILGWCSGSIF